jgi:hypothetical protein
MRAAAVHRPHHRPIAETEPLHHQLPPPRAVLAGSSWSDAKTATPSPSPAMSAKVASAGIIAVVHLCLSSGRLCLPRAQRSPAVSTLLSLLCPHLSASPTHRAARPGHAAHAHDTHTIALRLKLVLACLHTPLASRTRTRTDTPHRTYTPPSPRWPPPPWASTGSSRGFATKWSRSRI